MLKRIEDENKNVTINLRKCFERASQTLHVLVENMVQPEVSNDVFLKRYSDLTLNSVVKTLLRCEQLYQAREAVAKILGEVTEIEQLIKPRSLLWRVLQDDSGSQLSEQWLAMVWDFVRFLSKVLTEVSVFQAANKQYKSELVYESQPLRMTLHQMGRVALGYLTCKEEAGGTLLITGALSDSTKEKKLQLEEYEKWLETSIELTGKLRLPEAEQLSTLNQKKESRVT